MLFIIWIFVDGGKLYYSANIYSSSIIYPPYIQEYILPPKWYWAWLLTCFGQENEDKHEKHQFWG